VPTDHVARARDLYAAGHSRPQVVRAVFGADFPPEFYLVMQAVAESWSALDVEVMGRAWQVFRLADPAYQPRRDDWSRRLEAAAAAWYPDVVLVLVLSDIDVEHGGYVVGYHLGELRAGRPTAVGVLEDELDGTAPRSSSYSILGPSLLQVLHEYAADDLRMLRLQATKWENVRYGTLGDSVEVAEARVRRIEDLRRRADALPWPAPDA
jgi:hypothetical protein